MNKVLNKLLRRKRLLALQNGQTPSSRITNETVAEHRERILAGGRKFKYPLQYPKQRIVLITTLLLVLLIIFFSGFTFWRLYGAQDASKFMQSITQVLPLPVGSIDGQAVRYSDYLLELRSALHYLSTKEAVNFSSDDGKRQLDYQKRLALNKALENAYIHKLATANSTSVTNGELNAFLDKEIKHNKLGVTEDMYRQVIHDYYDWTFDDYRQSVRNQLLRKKVIASIDIDGRNKAGRLLQELRQGKDFAELSKAESEDELSKPLGGDLGFVGQDTDDPNGLLMAAAELQPGQFSQLLEGVDGFYIVKLIDKRGEEMHLAKILVSYKTFAEQLAALRQEGKVKEYISVPEL